VARARRQLRPPVVPGRADAIRVVPLAGAEELGAAAHGARALPPPHFVYGGGPLLSAVEVFTVFWGAGWSKTPLSTLATRVNRFFDFVVTSPLIDQLAEYSVPPTTIGHGKRTGSAKVSAPTPGASIADGALQHALQQWISTDPRFPHPGPNTLYFVYVPPGTVVVQGGGRSCSTFCGYHSDVAGQIFYAVMPYPGCSGCTGSLAVFDALTSTSSHELCEAITDPIAGRGWYDVVHGEIGDPCAWNTKKLGSYTVQLEWSNRAGTCV
jgi:hypothetical protein